MYKKIKKNKIKLIAATLIILLFFVSCAKKDELRPYVAYISFNDERKVNNITDIIMNSLEDYSEKINARHSNKKNDEELLESIEGYVKRDFDLIITSSFITNNEVESVANRIIMENNSKENSTKETKIEGSDANKIKETKFVVLDSVIDPVKENIKSVMFKTNESSFLAGYLAGLKTETNAVGYVGFNGGLVSDNYEFGFKAGVVQAAKEKDVEISIYSKKVDSFDNYKEGRKVANEIYKSDADIIYQTIGSTGLGVIDSAKENNKWVIGYDLDQSNLAPKNILTSTIKNYDIVTKDILFKFLEGNLKTGNKEYLGLKENAVGLVKYNPEKSNYSDEINRKVLEITKKIINGEIKVPFDLESYESFK